MPDNGGASRGAKPWLRNRLGRNADRSAGRNATASANVSQPRAVISSADFKDANLSTMALNELLAAGTGKIPTGYGRPFPRN